MQTRARSKQLIIALLSAGTAFTVGLLCGRGTFAKLEAGAAMDDSDATKRSSVEGVRMTSLAEQKGEVFASRLHEVLTARTTSQRDRSIASIADGLDSREIREALAGLERFYVPGREEVALRLLERWGEIDPEQAIEYAASVSKGNAGFIVNSDAIAAVLYGWLDKDPSAAEKWVVNAPEGSRKERGLQVLAEYFAGSDLPRALRIASQINFGEVNGEELAQSLFDRWTMTEPATAAAYAVQLQNLEWRTDALRAVVTRWTQEDPAAALNWARSIPGQQLRRRGLGDANDTPVEAGLSEWVQADARAAIDWVSALPEGNERAVLAATIRETFSYYMEIEPDTAKLLRAMPETDPEGNLFLQFCATQAARQNPEAVVAWMGSEEDPEIRSDLLRGVMSSFTGDQLSHILSEVDVQEVRLDLLAGDVVGKGITDPETFSRSALAKTNDPGLLKLIATSWLRKDPEKGKEWLQQSALSTAVKQEIMSQFGQ